MNPQIQKVTYHIEAHLDDDFDVVVLAKVAGYSHFHFCRVFKLHVGESVMSYAARLKLERAASQLTHKNKSMIEVALDAGYQTPTGFLKAFKARFNTTPTEYKKSTKVLLHKIKGSKMYTPRIIERDEINVAFTRELGDYMKSSDIAWNRLTKEMNDLEHVFAKKPPSIEMDLSEGNSEAIGICHDDPTVTDKSNLRYDAALSWGKKEVAELSKYGFETKSVAGGKYATVSYKGAKDAENAWTAVYIWVEENGHTFRDEPPFEKYIDAWDATDLNDIETEIYVPIV